MILVFPGSSSTFKAFNLLEASKLLFCCLSKMLRPPLPTKTIDFPSQEIRESRYGCVASSFLSPTC